MRIKLAVQPLRDQIELKERLSSNQYRNYPARPCENMTAATIQLEQEQEPHPSH